MFKNSRLILVMLTLVLMPLSAFAQINIKGTVVDGTGLPVIGASIFEKGTTNGTVSDVDGTFAKPSRYRTRSLPALGAMPSEEDSNEQLSII